MQPSEEQLIRRFECGDAAAFEALYARHRRRVYGYALSLTREAAWAADLTQEVWLAWIAQVGRIALRRTLLAYLLRSVRNRYFNDRRSQAVRERPLATPPRFVQAPEAAVDAERVRALNAALDALPEPQREVLLLRATGDLTFREMARLLGASLKTIQSRHRLGIEKLRVALEGKVDV